MILQGCRALARLSHISSQCLDKRATLSLALNITRVSSLQSPLLGSAGLTEITSIASSPYRHYATNAVSRPKAHTGQTTGRPRKQPSTTKAPPTKAASKPVAKKPAAKKTAAKKTKSKAKPKAKPRTKAKSTKARKKPAKAKKPKLTAERKAQQDIRDLKIRALSPPKGLPATAFFVLMTESTKEAKRPLGQGQVSVAAECSRRYKSFSPEEREHYNHIANGNKAVNASKYREWIQSFTPIQIKEANSARLSLRRRTKGTWIKLKDERLVKGLRSPYNLFYTHRYRSGDFAGMRAFEAAKLIGAEWRGLDASGKMTYSQLAEEDSARYDQEVKAVYNRDVQHTKPKAAAAAAA